MNKSLSSVSKDIIPGTIKSIINKPLGSCYSILFWSFGQKQIFVPLGKLKDQITCQGSQYLYAHIFRERTIYILYFHWRLWHRQIWLNLMFTKLFKSNFIRNCDLYIQVTPISMKQYEKRSFEYYLNKNSSRSIDRELFL